MDKYFLAVSNEDASVLQHRENMREQERRDTALDEALGFTFPASDPVAVNCGVTAFLVPKREQLRITIDFFKRAWTQSRS
ncbi:hypothetical protein [Noviherbaspirillum sp. ST9]|uniref:hypothetical protein n=1 Tax=Noviherbaspirillum sp. ST9 TaxID=3401606 RepID=UPI003B58A57D